MMEMQLTFVQRNEYTRYKAHYDKLYRLGSLFIEKATNIFIGRMYWIPGKSVYSEVSFVVNNEITMAEQYAMVDEILDRDRVAFITLEKQSAVGNNFINQL